MNRVLEILGTEYPIIQGGMANIADHRLASAVSNAGGLGIIGAGGWDVDKVREEIQKCRELTDKPFGVNVMLMSPHSEAISDMIIEEGIKVVTTGAGNPGIYMEKWHAAGMKVIPVIPGIALAKRVIKAGADAIIVEGTEAGGHIGNITTFALVPQVADVVDIPVIAAGGIGDARGFDAAYCLGAEGVQIGTVLLASEECPIHDNYKNAVVKAKDNSTVVTGVYTGAPVRVIRNKMARKYIEMTKYGEVPLEELEKLTLGSLRKAVVDGDKDNGSLMAGQIAGMVKEVRPVKDILDSIYKESRVYKGTLK